MPATIPNIKPKNNRMLTSSSLKTHSVWKNSVKYDPYAEAGEQAEATPSDNNEQFRTLLKLANTNNESNSRFWKGKQGLRGVFPEPMYGYEEEVTSGGPKQQLDPSAFSSSSESESEAESDSPSGSESDSSHDRSRKKRKREKSEKKKSKKRKREKREKKDKKRKRKDDKGKKKSKKKSKSKKRRRRD